MTKKIIGSCSLTGCRSFDSFSPIGRSCSRSSSPCSLLGNTASKPCQIVSHEPNFVIATSETRNRFLEQDKVSIPYDQLAIGVRTKSHYRLNRLGALFCSENSGRIAVGGRPSKASSSYCSFYLTALDVTIGPGGP